MTKESITAKKWDIFVRTSHWLMVLLIATCWYTAENGEMQWHFYSGYALLFVVLLRILWGFFGSKSARFVHFLRSPKNVINYIRNIRSNNYNKSTHSPTGGYSVLALLALMLSQTILGLFAVETDGFDGGPFSEVIDYDLSLKISELHQLNFDILLFFVGLHLVAIAFYQLVLKQKLLQRMSFFK